MFKQILLGIFLAEGLLVGTVWANDALNKELNYSAIPFGNMAKVEELIAKGADVKSMDSNGVTPLRQAIIGCKLDVVKLLIAKGADVKAKATNGNMPLHVLTSTMSCRSTDPMSCHSSCKSVAELLIAKGADVNAKDQNENTPLHGAALAMGRPTREVIELLIAKGRGECKKFAGLYPTARGGFKKQRPLLCQQRYDRTVDRQGRGSERESFKW